ncbi:MAG TPA: creatininase family protein [Terriglobia bacterium]|nr:creatininase family protein [Terriglobia bacterium]
MSIHRLERLFPNEITERIARTPILVIPLGTIEWHSHHLPLGLDGLVAAAVSEKIAERADAVLAPVSYWAVGGIPFPYTLNLSASIVEPVLEAVFEQYAAMGFRVIVAFTGHFGLEQTISVKRAALAVMRKSDVAILAVAEYDFTTDIGYTGDHAGVGETSLLWAADSTLVRLESVPSTSPLEGVIGEDPRGKASRDWGNKLMDTISSCAAEVALRFLHQDEKTRKAFMEALDAGVLALELIAEQRRLFGRENVPPIATPSYRSHLEAIYQGDYAAAKIFAAQKLSDLSS